MYYMPHVVDWFDSCRDRVVSWSFNGRTLLWITACSVG